MLSFFRVQPLLVIPSRPMRVGRLFLAGVQYYATIMDGGSDNFSDAGRKPVSVWYSLLIAAIVLALDYFTGPFIHFPITYILPVAFIAWHNGRIWGLLLAVILPSIRFYFTTLWTVPWGRAESLSNQAIQITVLVVFAIFVDRASRQTKALAEEVKVLRGILPICSFCKKLRTVTGEWHQMEKYISENSEAKFSHSFCPECEKQHYGSFIDKV
ncbi:MAG: hypothetical protein L0229_05060 [Blastocatellia bacterium]|nr:hypothetical protein [Blastocatellia bacterium]